MCVAVPLKVTQINDRQATGELWGIKKNIRIDLVRDIKLGDYVMVHAGFAIQKIKNEEALEIINALSEVYK